MSKGTIILSAVTAFVIGLATAVVTAVVEAKGAMPSAASWLVAVLGALAIAAKDNRALMKLPPVEGDEAPTAKSGPGRGVGLLVLALFLGLFLTTGATCRKLDPGASPVVVRTEQLLTSAQATFLFTLQVDQKDRGFWRSNAPAFHAFCETLRRPTTYQGTNVLPQYRVWLLSLDDVKLDYKAGRTSSNALATAGAALTSLMNQASAWSTIVTNRQPQSLIP